MMYSAVVLLILMINGLSSSTSESQSSSSVSNLFLQTLIKTFDTPVSIDNVNAKFSLEIMLANDVFNLDDALRLFIQQYLLALYDKRLHLLPDDWDTRYPAYATVISEINNILDIIGDRKLSEISMKDIRPFIQTLTPAALIDLQRLLNTLAEKEKEEEEAAAANSTNEEL